MSNDVVLSDKQGDAIRLIREWYRGLDWMTRSQLASREPDAPAAKEDRPVGFVDNGAPPWEEEADQGYEDYAGTAVVPPERQVFRLFGFAGTGKTTITRHAIDDLGLVMDGLAPSVRFGAFTGKASYVMRKHGTPARTIHSLIYSVSSASEAQIEAAKEKLEKLVAAALPLVGMDRVVADAQISALKAEIKKMHLPDFGINLESDVVDCKLIVLDEVSMVNEEMGKHLLSFGKPILVLGDPGQLPPIRGEGYFTNNNAPDVMLTEIHRQASDSAIIRLATAAREGRPIDYGKHSDTVWKLRKTDVEPSHLLRSDQVICGRNATRFELNNAMRSASGFDRSVPYPTSPDEKVICLRNDNSKGLINGMFLKMSDAEVIPPPSYRSDSVRFRSVIHTEDGDLVGGTNAKGRPKTQDVYLGHFLDHQSVDPDRSERDWKDKRGLVEATFGWAITCHKAQGSQFDNLIVWDDHLGRSPADRARWLYTAITRAAEGLVILD